MSLSRVYVRGSRLRWQSCVAFKLKRNLSPSKAKAALLALRFLLTYNLNILIYGEKLRLIMSV